MHGLLHVSHGQWPSYQIRKTVSCACARNAGDVFPTTDLPQRKVVVSDPGMHHDTCVTHVSWCMSGSLTRGGGENVPGIPGACATQNCMYLVKGPLYGSFGYYYKSRISTVYSISFTWHLPLVNMLQCDYTGSQTNRPDARKGQLIVCWWRHQMETFSALLARCVGNSPVAGEFPSQSQRRGALMFSFVCALNKRLRKPSWGWWFEAPSRSLWRHVNELKASIWPKYNDGKPKLYSSPNCGTI